MISRQPKSVEQLAYALELPWRSSEMVKKYTKSNRIQLEQLRWCFKKTSYDFFYNLKKE